MEVLTKSSKRQIIATSGGFSIEPRNKRLDRYILAQVAAQTPKICFIPTASGDSKNYIKRFYNFFEKENCICSHLQLFKGNFDDLNSFLLQQDILYIGGGNTKNMLVLWKEWGIDQILRQAYQKGILLCGISAGSLCWFEQGLSDAIPNKLTTLNCLGFIEGSNCPFFNAEVKRETYKTMLQNQQIMEGIATEMGVGLHYENEYLTKVISSRKSAKAYQYSLQNNMLVEKILRPIYL
ncbi:MAG: Type 1 glutamine amidotransferase-like domain-containing protein [Chitinophagales bacterium]